MPCHEKNLQKVTHLQMKTKHFHQNVIKWLTNKEKAVKIASK